MPYLPIMFKNKDMRNNIINQLDLDEEEVEWLIAELLGKIVGAITVPISANLLTTQIHDTERVLGVKMMTDEIPDDFAEDDYDS